MPNKYHEALEVAICDIINRADYHAKVYSENALAVTYRNECIECLKELQRFLDTPQLKQSLKELDLGESK